jgi:hypothetical protein
MVVVEQDREDETVESRSHPHPFPHPWPLPRRFSVDCRENGNLRKVVPGFAGLLGGAEKETTIMVNNHKVLNTYSAKK